MHTNDKKDLLRHWLATLLYRTRSALQGAPTDFDSFQAGADVRTPQELLQHMSNLMTHTAAGLRGSEPGPLAPGLAWSAEVARFESLVAELSAVLVDVPVGDRRLAERLLQGPLSDAMCHAGQLALLRRLAGSPVPHENFFEAAIDAEAIGGGGTPAPSGLRET